MARVPHRDQNGQEFFFVFAKKFAQIAPKAALAASRPDTWFGQVCSPREKCVSSTRMPYRPIPLPSQTVEQNPSP